MDHTIYTNGEKEMRKTASKPYRRFSKPEREIYFIEWTVIGWVDLFVKDVYTVRLTSALKWLCEKKGLLLYDYIILPNRLVMMAGAAYGNLHDTLKLFDEFTSKAMLEMMRSGFKDPRKQWMPPVFDQFNEGSSKKHPTVWQEAKAPLHLPDHNQVEERIRYMNELPVMAGFVEKPIHYRYSSANPKNPLNDWLVSPIDR